MQPRRKIKVFIFNHEAWFSHSLFLKTMDQARLKRIFPVDWFLASLQAQKRVSPHIDLISNTSILTDTQHQLSLNNVKLKFKLKFPLTITFVCLIKRSTQLKQILLHKFMWLALLILTINDTKDADQKSKFWERHRHLLSYCLPDDGVRNDIRLSAQKLVCRNCPAHVYLTGVPPPMAPYWIESATYGVTSKFDHFLGQANWAVKNNG